MEALPPKGFGVKPISQDEVSFGKQVQKPKTTKSSGMKGYFHSKLASKQSAKVDQLFDKVNTSSVELIDDEQRNMARKVVNFGAQLKMKRDEMVSKGVESPAFAEEFSELEKNFIRISKEFGKFISKKPGKKNLEEQRSLEKQLTNALSSFDNLDNQLRNQKLEQALKKIDGIARQAEGIPADIAEDLSRIYYGLDSARISAEVLPELSAELSNLQSSFVRLVSDFETAFNKKEDLTSIKARLDIDKQSFNSLQESLRNSAELSSNYKGVLGNEWRSLVQRQEGSGDDFLATIKEKSGDALSLAKKWNIPRNVMSNLSYEDVSSAHPNEMEDALNRDGLVVRGRKVEGGVDEAGDALVKLFLRSENVGSFDGRSKQLLRYEIENTLTQVAKASNRQQLAKINDNYTNADKTISEYNPQNRDKFKVDFHHPNSITITRTDFVQVIDDKRNIVGYDAVRTVITIDLSKVKEDKLLQSKDAVSVQTIVHGFRKTEEEVFNDAVIVDDRSTGIDRVNDKLSQLETELIKLGNYTEEYAEVMPLLPRWYSSLQQLYNESRSDFLKLLKGDPGIKLNQLEVNIDGYIKFSKNLDGIHELAEYAETPGKKFETAITEKVDGHSLVDEWNNAKPREDLATFHHHQFYVDANRVNMLIGGKKVNKNTVKNVSDDQRQDISNEAGNEIVRTLSESKTVGKFDDRTKRLMQYEIESFFSQTMSTFSNDLHEQTAKDYAKYNLLFASFGEVAGKADKRSDTDTLQFTLTPPDTLTIVRKDYFLIKDRDNENVVGYDGMITTVTVDLSKVTPEELLASKGAVSIQSMKHGYRENLADVKL